jgi:uncharacterized protein
MRAAIVDTGPLVALFDTGDRDHAAVLKWFSTQSASFRLLSTEAVVTEVTHMLDFHVGIQTAFLDWARDSLQIVPVSPPACETIAKWMRGYAKVPMDFADATVLWLYSQTPNAEIVTLDQRGFGVFRLPGAGKKIPSVVNF